MRLKDYTEKRNGLLNAMQEAIDGGKLEDAAAKKTEIEALDDQWDQHKEVQASLNALRGSEQVSDIAASSATLDVTNANTEAIGVGSDAYRAAFLKHMTGRDDQMTKLENAAFVHTTTTTSAPLPTTMVNNIWDLVSETHCIVGDLTTYRTGTIM